MRVLKRWVRASTAGVMRALLLLGMKGEAGVGRIKA